MPAFSTVKSASVLGFLDSLAGKISTSLALLVGQLHCHGGAAAVGRLLDSRIDLSNPAIEVSDDTGLHRWARLGVGSKRPVTARLASGRVPDVGLRQEAVSPDARIEAIALPCGATVNHPLQDARPFGFELVARVDYLGPSGDIFTPNEQCAYALEACAAR